jgi:hypothetical protein
LPGFLCENRDNCFRNGPCGNNGLCVETSDGVAHCNCNIGFQGPTCSMTNPCEPNPCQNNGQCEATSGLSGGFKCNCQRGFLGNLQQDSPVFV